MLADHLDEVNRVATEHLKGLTPTEISISLGLQRTRVVALLDDWRSMVASNEAIHARAREALAGADQHFGTLIGKLYEVIEVADATSDIKNKTTAIKTIADIESKRLDMLHRAGLLDNQELAEQLADQERKHDVITNILRDIARNHPEIRNEIARGLSKAAGSQEIVVIDA